MPRRDGTELRYSSCSANKIDRSIDRLAKSALQQLSRQRRPNGMRWHDSAQPLGLEGELGFGPFVWLFGVWLRPRAAWPRRRTSLRSHASRGSSRRATARAAVAGLQHDRPRRDCGSQSVWPVWRGRPQSVPSSRRSTCRAAALSDEPSEVVQLITVRAASAVCGSAANSEALHSEARRQ